jgi:PAS domain S-box-containing protein
MPGEMTPMPGRSAARALLPLFKPRPAILLAAALSIALLWVVAVERVQYERRVAVEDAVREHTNLALAFEQQTLRAIRAADAALLYLRREYLDHGAFVDLRELSDVGLLDDALVRNYLITDAQGRVLNNAFPRGPIDVGDRDFFLFHRESGGRNLFVSKPLTGRVTGKPLISLSRAIHSRDGAFAGVVAVALDPEYFLDTYNALDLGPRGIIQLVGLDGVVRVRRVGSTKSVGREMKDSSLLAMAAAAPTASFVSRGVHSDGLPRLQSYRVLAEHALVVSVGKTEADVLAVFDRRRLYYYGGAAAATLGVIVFAVIVLITGARRERAEAENRAAQSRYRATFDEAPIGIAHTDLDGRFLNANARCCHMLGFDKGELVGRRTTDFTHPEDVAKSIAMHERALADGTEGAPPVLEKRFVRKDGSVLWAITTSAAVHAEAGEPQYLVVMLRDITVSKQQEERLLEQLDELHRFQKVTVDRELRMIELEAEIRAMKEKAAA